VQKQLPGIGALPPCQDSHLTHPEMSNFFIIHDSLADLWESSPVGIFQIGLLEPELLAEGATEGPRGQHQIDGNRSLPSMGKCWKLNVHFRFNVEYLGLQLRYLRKIKTAE